MLQMLWHHEVIAHRQTIYVYISILDKNVDAQELYFVNIAHAIFPDW